MNCSYCICGILEDGKTNYFSLSLCEIVHSFYNSLIEGFSWIALPESSLILCPAISHPRLCIALPLPIHHSPFAHPPPIHCLSLAHPLLILFPSIVHPMRIHCSSLRHPSSLLHPFITHSLPIHCPSLVHPSPIHRGSIRMFSIQIPSYKILLPIIRPSFSHPLPIVHASIPHLWPILRPSIVHLSSITLSALITDWPYLSHSTNQPFAYDADH